MNIIHVFVLFDFCSKPMVEICD